MQQQKGFNWLFCRSLAQLTPDTDSTHNQLQFLPTETNRQLLLGATVQCQPPKS